MPAHLQGRSLKPMLDDPRAKGREIAISTMIAIQTKTLGHSVRADAFRYIAWDQGKGASNSATSAPIPTNSTISPPNP